MSNELSEGKSPSSLLFPQSFVPPKTRIISGVPFLPNSVNLLSDVKYELLSDAPSFTIVEPDHEAFERSSYPDIILILNESLCDISYYSTVDEGAEVLAPIHQIPGIISGYSVASLIGGGTNNSEYELLTSNSMAGLSISAPFLVLNMENTNSIVSYLGNYGYYSVAMHCGAKTNYGRNRAYPAIG